MLYVYVCLGVSAALNLYLGYQLYNKKNVLDVDAKRLLSNILAGPTVVRIDVIDPSGLMYRSPRG